MFNSADQRKNRFHAYPVASAAKKHPIFGGSSNPSWAKNFRQKQLRCSTFRLQLKRPMKPNANTTRRVKVVRRDWSIKLWIWKVSPTCTKHTVSLAQLPTKWRPWCHSHPFATFRTDFTFWAKKRAQVQLALFLIFSQKNKNMANKHPPSRVGSLVVCRNPPMGPKGLAEAMTSDTLLTCCSTFRCCSLAITPYAEWLEVKTPPDIPCLPASSPFIRTSLTSKHENSLKRISTYLTDALWPRACVCSWRICCWSCWCVWA